MSIKAAVAVSRPFPEDAEASLGRRLPFGFIESTQADLMAVVPDETEHRRCGDDLIDRLPAELAGPVVGLVEAEIDPSQRSGTDGTCAADTPHDPRSASPASLSRRVRSIDMRGGASDAMRASSGGADRPHDRNVRRRPSASAQPSRGRQCTSDQDRGALASGRTTARGSPPSGSTTTATGTSPAPR